MSSESTPLLSQAPPRGTYAPAPQGASRSPCPVLNALANHGYIERSGRDILMRDLNASMQYVGMSNLLGSIFAKPPYLEFQDPNRAFLQKPLGFFTKLWRLIKNPYSFFYFFGCWKRGQIDTKTGKKVIDLENLATHGAIEHDISITRRDVAQKEGNNAPQKDLIADMLTYSSDGKTITVEDFGRFIKHRIRQQLEDNPNLLYGPDQHIVNCGQVALLMHCFGNGKSVPCSYVRAIFEDERLPWEEGWKKRTWWTVGVIEFFGAVKKIKGAVGVNF